MSLPVPHDAAAPGCTGALGWSRRDAQCLSMLHPSVLTGSHPTPQCSGQGRQERRPQTWPGSGNGNGSGEGNARTVSQRL